MTTRTATTEPIVPKFLKSIPARPVICPGIVSRDFWGIAIFTPETSTAGAVTAGRARADEVLSRYSVPGSGAGTVMVGMGGAVRSIVGVSGAEVSGAGMEVASEGCTIIGRGGWGAVTPAPEMETSCVDGGVAIGSIETLGIGIDMGIFIFLFRTRN